MDHFEAFDIIKNRILADGDPQAIAALRVLTGAPGRVPPGPLQGLGRSALEFAQQVAKTGEAFGWHTPPHHSEAMERLIHRLSLLLEVFLDVYEAGQLREAAGGYQRPRLIRFDAPAVVDEFHQREYCDDCGQELNPEGVCLYCAGTPSLLTNEHRKGEA